LLHWLQISNGGLLSVSKQAAVMLSRHLGMKICDKRMSVWGLFGGFSFANRLVFGGEVVHGGYRCSISYELG